MYDPAKRRKERYKTDPEFRQRSIELGKQWYQRKKNDPEFQKRKKEYNKKNAGYFNKKTKLYNQRQPFHYAFKRLRLRARNENIPCDIDEAYLKSIWTGNCAIFGTPLCAPYSTHSQDPNKATVDKIIPEEGYVGGNVQWVSNRANIIKSYGTLQEHEAVISYIKKHIATTSTHPRDQLSQL